MAAVFVTSGGGAMYLAEHEGNAFKDVKLQGGSILGASLLVSPGAGNRLILIDAAEIAHNDDGLEVESSNVASVELLDNPTNNSATGTGTALVSAWQTGMLIVKLIRFVNWQKLRGDAVGFIELPIGGSP